MHHLRVTVADLVASVEWYQGLGFIVLAEDLVTDGSFLGSAAAIDVPTVRLRLPDEGFQVILMQWNSPEGHGRHYEEPNHAGWFRAALGVDDTQGSYDAMSAEGWEFLRAPMLVELTGTPVPDMWICFTADPNGVAYEFVQRPRSAFRPE
jgi:catechol 2,3-dioxygenase-like lactoylglutathione lyase family enzyme